MSNQTGFVQGTIHALNQVQDWFFEECTPTDWTPHWTGSLNASLDTADAKQPSSSLKTSSSLPVGNAVGKGFSIENEIIEE
jgi:hypothetical protein